ncbi:MAG: phage holin family protein [Burkholderiales bacterium]|nr:phage holin family protein [Burkholderiales bacterium]
MAAEDRPHADPAPERVTQALRGWLHDGVALLRVRLELFGVEAREHALASVELLLAGLAALLFLGLGLGFFAVLLTVLLWDSHRLLALAVFSTLFLTLGLVALVLLRQRWQTTQRWFDASLEELRQDDQRLSP